MSRYSEALKGILSVFDKPAWVATSIKTYPQNFPGIGLGNKYIRVNIVCSGLGINRVSTSGQMIIDIFTPAGAGPLEPFAISDILDGFLMEKSITTVAGVVQFKSSSLQSEGLDKANPALYRSTYVIPFNFFGV